MFWESESRLLRNANEDSPQPPAIIPPLPSGGGSPGKDADGDVVMVDAYIPLFALYGPNVFTNPPLPTEAPLDLAHAHVPSAQNRSEGITIPSAVSSPSIFGNSTIPSTSNADARLPSPTEHFSVLSEVHVDRTPKQVLVSTNFNGSGFYPPSHLCTDVIVPDLHRGLQVLKIKLCCQELLRTFPELMPRIYFPDHGETFAFRGENDEFFLNFRAEMKIYDRGTMKTRHERPLFNFVTPTYVGPRQSVRKRKQEIRVIRIGEEERTQIIRNKPLIRPSAPSYCPEVPFFEISKDDNDFVVVTFFLHPSCVFPPPGSLLIFQFSLFAEIPNFFEMTNFGIRKKVGKVATQFWMKKSNQKSDCDATRSRGVDFVRCENSSFFSNVCLETVNAFARVIRPGSILSTMMMMMMPPPPPPASSFRSLPPPPPPPSLSHPSTLPVPLTAPPVEHLPLSVPVPSSVDPFFDFRSADGMLDGGMMDGGLLFDDLLFPLGLGEDGCFGLDEDQDEDPLGGELYDDDDF